MQQKPEVLAVTSQLQDSKRLLKQSARETSLLYPFTPHLSNTSTRLLWEKKKFLSGLLKVSHFAVICV